MTIKKAVWCAALSVGALSAQQPNAVFARFTVDGNDGPSYPMSVNVRNATATTLAWAGAANARFLLALSATGHVQAGAASVFGDALDLPLSPPPVAWLDGFAGPGAGFFVTGPQGSFSTAVVVPGAVPVGATFGLQAMMDDPSSPFGFSLTAATEIAVTQGPTVTTLAFADTDDGVALVDLAPAGLTVPFYGVAYSKLEVHINGYVVPTNAAVAGVPDFTPSVAEFAAGAPRIAGLWLDQYLPAGVGAIQATIDANPPGQPAFVSISFQSTAEFPGGFGLFNYAVRLDAQGRVDVSHPFATSSPYTASAIVGISPGGGLGPTPTTAKDLSALDAGGTYVGAISESFFEQYLPGFLAGTSTALPPFDLFGRTLSFLPSAPGSLPQSADAYVLF